MADALLWLITHLVHDLVLCQLMVSEPAERGLLKVLGSVIISPFCTHDKVVELPFFVPVLAVLIIVDKVWQAGVRPLQYHGENRSTGDGPPVAIGQVGPLESPKSPRHLVNVRVGQGQDELYDIAAEPSFVRVIAVERAVTHTANNEAEDPACTSIGIDFITRSSEPQIATSYVRITAEGCV